MLIFYIIGLTNDTKPQTGRQQLLEYCSHHRTIDLNTRMCCHLRVYLRFWREKVDQHRPHIASVGTLKDPSHRQAHSQRKKIVHFSRRRVTKLRNARTNFFFFFRNLRSDTKGLQFWATKMDQHEIGLCSPMQKELLAIIRLIKSNYWLLQPASSWPTRSIAWSPDPEVMAHRTMFVFLVCAASKDALQFFQSFTLFIFTQLLPGSASCKATKESTPNHKPSTHLRRHIEAGKYVDCLDNRMFIPMACNTKRIGNQLP